MDSCGWICMGLLFSQSCQTWVTFFAFHPRFVSRDFSLVAEGCIVMVLVLQDSDALHRLWSRKGQSQPLPRHPAVDMTALLEIVPWKNVSSTGFKSTFSHFSPLKLACIRFLMGGFPLFSNNTIWLNQRQSSTCCAKVVETFLDKETSRHPRWIEKWETWNYGVVINGD